MGNSNYRDEQIRSLWTKARASEISRRRFLSCWLPAESPLLRRGTFMYKLNYFITAILILVLFVSACATPAATPVPTSTRVVTPTATAAQTPTPTRTPAPLPASPSPTITPSPTPTAASQTAGQLADVGKNVFAKSCTKCHGEKGEGTFAPSLIGPNMRLGTFNNAKGLMDFVSSAMPMDAPGSLSRQEYLQVLSFLLLQNDLAGPATNMELNQLPQIQLKK